MQIQVSPDHYPASAGNPNILVCERGNMFGYSDLVVDPRNLVLMRDAGCPVTADITHALQQPTGRSLEVSYSLRSATTSVTCCLHAAAQLWRGYVLTPVQSG